MTYPLSLTPTGTLLANYELFCSDTADFKKELLFYCLQSLEEMQRDVQYNPRNNGDIADKASRHYNFGKATTNWCLGQW